ncbi:MAG: hypothetical protein R3Y13_00345 [bacterium]
MKYFVTVSNNLGLSFFNKRQSSDIKVLEDMIKEAENSKILVNKSALDIFTKNNLEQHITTSESSYVFYECDELSSIKDINILIVYYWNRDYPSDKFLKLNLNAYKELEKIEFQGNSHDNITKIVYERK